MRNLRYRLAWAEGRTLGGHHLEGGYVLVRGGWAASMFVHRLALARSLSPRDMGSRIDGAQLCALP